MPSLILVFSSIWGAEIDKNIPRNNNKNIFNQLFIAIMAKPPINVNNEPDLLPDKKPASVTKRIKLIV
jgi:hypothetical protein